MIKVAINGFGRIGRVTARVLMTKYQRKFQLCAINDLGDLRSLGHLFKYDSNYGTYQGSVRHTNDYLQIDSTKIHSFAEKDPVKLPWDELGIDIVFECTGKFTSAVASEAHLRAGAKKVIISAPAKGDLPTYVIGVNHQELKNDPIISNASCTTNCIAPVMAVLCQEFGVIKAMMTTAHAYTADQNLQDGPHRDLRRARSAAINLTPTSTGAAITTGKVIKELADCFDGLAIRVPSPIGSLADITALLKSSVDVDQINDAFIQASKTPRYRGILETTSDPIVSTDIVGSSASAIVDLGLTQVVGGDLVKIIAWYDNEWAYSHRLIELAEMAYNISLSNEVN